MQKSVDRGSDFKIRSVIALDHLQNFIYIEADMEAHVKEVLLAAKDTIFLSYESMLIFFSFFPVVNNRLSRACGIFLQIIRFLLFR